MRIRQAIAIEPRFDIPGKSAIGADNTFAVLINGGVMISALPDTLNFIQSMSAVKHAATSPVP